MNTLAHTGPDVVRMAAPADWRSRLVSPVFPEDEGELVLTALKLPKKLRDRIDAAAKATGNNRTQTVIALCRWALDQFEAQREEEKAKKKK